MSPVVNRLFVIAFAGAVLVAGCSGSDDSASSTSPPVEESVDETTTTIDNRTDEEIAIDRLDVLMFGLGVTDLENTSNCVVERLESENIEVTGEGTSELIALFGCDEDAISQWLPAANPLLPTDAWSCTVDGIADWISALSIPETEEFFAAAEPPTEFTESTATRCDVSADDLIAALS